MRVNHTGRQETYDGNIVGKYGIDMQSNTLYFVHFMEGIGGERLWAMDADVFERISVSVDTILIADHENGLYKAQKSDYNERVVDGRRQYFISNVEHVGDPADHLRQPLWFDSGNRVEENCHAESNH
jgi:hypothetical protein